MDDGRKMELWKWMEDGWKVEAIRRHILSYVLEFGGELATDNWLHLGRQAGGAFFGTYLATFWADCDECMRNVRFEECWPSAARAQARRKARSQKLFYRNSEFRF